MAKWIEFVETTPAPKTKRWDVIPTDGGPPPRPGPLVREVAYPRRLSSDTSAA